MPFYNPYMKGPDFGSGVSDMKSKVLQLLMLLTGGGGATAATPGNVSPMTSGAVGGIATPQLPPQYSSMQAPGQSVPGAPSQGMDPGTAQGIAAIKNMSAEQLMEFVKSHPDLMQKLKMGVGGAGRSF